MIPQQRIGQFRAGSGLVRQRIGQFQPGSGLAGHDELHASEKKKSHVRVLYKCYMYMKYCHIWKHDITMIS